MNATFTIPTSKQILERAVDRQKSDVFGFETNDYLLFMDFADAKTLLRPDITEAMFNNEKKTLTRELMLSTMKDYMAFAWEKANDCRGLSAQRSLMHFIAWTWLAGEPELSAKIVNLYETQYQFYGKDILVEICKHYGWDHTQWDNGKRTNGEE